MKGEYIKWRQNSKTTLRRLDNDITVRSSQSKLDELDHACLLWFQIEEMKTLLGNVSEIHKPKVNPNFRRIATPPPDTYSLLDDFDLIEDQLLFSTTNSFNDKDAGKCFV